MIRRPPAYSGPERRRTPRRKIRPRRALFALLALAGAGYAAATIWLLAQETRWIIQAVQTLGDTRPSFPYEQVDLPQPGGDRQFAWVMRHDGRDDGPWVLYLHGSPSTIASPVNISRYRLLRDLGLNVLAPEYRGFGGLEGTPSEAGLLADAFTAYGYLRRERGVPRSHVVVYGWSLGAAVAVDLAGHVDPAAVILEGAPASMADLNEARYPLFPVRLLMRSPFDAVHKIRAVRSPLLFLHSAEDAVVPIAEGRRLFDAASGDKRFVEVRGGHVAASEVDAERFTREIGRFLTAHGPRVPQP
jgi:uncharacterized protein